MNKRQKVLYIWLAITFLLNIGLTKIQIQIANEQERIYNTTMDSLTENIQESTSEIIEDNESMGNMINDINDTLQIFSDSMNEVGKIGKKAWSFSIEWYIFIFFYILGIVLGWIIECLIRTFTEKDDASSVLYCVNFVSILFTIYSIISILRIVL